ncbi:MAG TPA: dihydrolipoyl dehydrogenase [Candidatus Hydrogenedentes bacterium]|nr:dihydrolipoyl dehydrogenase [Candidatus Hydrogenedentota bacterium]HRK35010.1 dihydrolipoyl dehydrogenase [Candidatus Hydrogenedentota bacterium]
MSKETGKRVVIIGGGPGGYAAAFMAADLGLDVTMIDLETNPGGVCLYRGCIPSKALLHVAKVLHEAEDAEHWGITYPKPKINLEKTRAAKDAVVAKMTGGLGQLCKARKVNYVQGRASFEDSTTIKVTSQDGAEKLINTDYTILAAGSRPVTIPELFVESDRIWNSTTALQLQEVPKSLLVVGGGYIGLELGSVYAALGSKVTVVEMTPSLLPGADEDLVTVLAQRIEKNFESVLLNTKVVGVEEEKNGIAVTLEAADGKTRTETFDNVLVSIGRKPNSSGLGLNHTKVVVNARGFVEVDEQRRTADAAIFAIGDIAGDPMLAHKASHEGRVAAEVIAGHNVAFEPRAIPAVVFTDPELAWCGITEQQAKKENREVNVARFPWSASGRASTIHRNDGLTKLITEPETNRVLGVGIVGSGAGELIAQGVIAIEMGATATDVGMSIHPHPTLSETIMESADVIFGNATHLYRPKKK